MTTRSRRRPRLADPPPEHTWWAAAEAFLASRTLSPSGSAAPIWLSEPSAASDIELDVILVELGRGMRDESLRLGDQCDGTSHEEIVEAAFEIGSALVRDQARSTTTGLRRNVRSAS